MAVINILTDFFILCLPMPMLRSLQLPRKQKVLLGLVFALGSGYERLLSMLSPLAHYSA